MMNAAGGCRVANPLRPVRLSLSASARDELSSSLEYAWNMGFFVEQEWTDASDASDGSER